MTLKAICIGGDYCATDWLYSQLRAHNAFWKPPLRESGYLSTNYFKRKQALIASRLIGYSQRLAAGAGDEQDILARISYLNRIATARVDTRFDVDQYLALHDSGGHGLSMDVSAEYSDWMPEQTISAIAEADTPISVFLIVRNPMERLWASAQAVFQLNGDSSHLENLSSFQDFAGRVDVFHKSFLSLCFADWSRYWPAERLKVIDYADILYNPERVQRAIAQQLNVDPEGFAINPHYSIATEPLQDFPIKLEIESWLTCYFGSERRKLREILRGPYSLLADNEIRLSA